MLERLRRVILFRVKEQLIALVRLQQLDERIRVQRNRLASIPEELGEREAAYSAREAGAEQMEAERKSCLARAQDLENDSAKHEGRLAKLEEQIVSARDAGAIAVARHEADGLRVKVAEAQEEALRLLEEADQFAKSRDEAREALQEQRDDLESFRAIASTDEQSLNQELRELEQDRAALQAPLLSTATAIYEKVAGSRDGRAVAPLRGGSCAGCGANLPANEQAKVAMAKALYQCRSCSRILVSMDVWSSVDR